MVTTGDPLAGSWADVGLAMEELAGFHFVGCLLDLHVHAMFLAVQSGLLQLYH